MSERLYRRLAAGTTVAGALAESQQALGPAGGNLVLLGDGQTRLTALAGNDHLTLSALDSVSAIRLARFKLP